MIAAAGYDLLKSAGSLSTGDIPVFAVGFVVSFVSAVLVVRVFVAFVARSSFAAFAWYRIAFGALLLIWYGRHPG
jgi:undecaprenyl-diphosphatase